MPCNYVALLRLGFPTAPLTVNLATNNNSLTHYTKGTQSPSEEGSYCLYVRGFRIYFTPLTGVLFAFPSRY